MATRPCENENNILIALSKNYQIRINYQFHDSAMYLFSGTTYSRARLWKVASQPVITLRAAAV